MKEKNAMKDTLGSKQSPAPPIERIVSGIISQLPLLDPRTLDEAVAEAKERPRASIQFLLDGLSSDDESLRAVSAYILERLDGTEIMDELNGLIFDASQTPHVKVLANDILRRFGNPMDADVFNMTVPNAEKEHERLPSRVVELVREGRTTEAVEHARRLGDADRWLAMISVAEQAKAGAMPLLESLAHDSEENAKAAATAITVQKIEEGVPLILQLQAVAGRDFQRVLRRMLYELKEAGVEVPEEKAEEPEGAPAGKQTEDEGLPLFRAMMSEPSPQGLVLVTIARRRSNGRLKVFSVVVDPWKRGIHQAGLRLDMSRSAFDRFVEGQSGSRVKMRQTSVEECRKIVARGVRVAQEFGVALPYDFGIGRSLIGNLDEEITEIAHPFPCSRCGAPLDEETVERIRAAAPYEHMPVETRCESCREKA
jgi:hypothetical protein